MPLKFQVFINIDTFNNVDIKFDKPFVGRKKFVDPKFANIFFQLVPGAGPRICEQHTILNFVRI